MRACCLVLLLLSLFNSIASAEDAVDAYINSKMQELHLPGIAVAVVHKGTPVKIAAYGYSNLELKTPATTDSVFELGSVTKQFTGAGILMLAREGKLALEDPLGKHFTDVPASWKKITVQQLLTHTGGIANYLGFSGFPDIHHDGNSHDEITKLFFEKLPLEYPAGQSWSYSNSGYLILGNLIEHVSGKTYWEFLNERIFLPAGMASARSSDPRAIIPQRASGYEWVSDHFENRAALAENAYAAGSIVSNIRDMVLWDAAIRSNKILDLKSWEIAWSPAKSSTGKLLPFNYGFGWTIERYHGRRVISHSGGTPGFSSVIYRFPEDELTVILLTNHSDRVIDHLAIDIAGMYVSSLARPATASASDEEIPRVLADLFAGKPDAKRFTTEMQIFLTTVTGKGIWGWLGADGPIRKFELSEKECEGQLCTSRYRAMLGSITRWFSVTTTPEGKIAQINWW